MLPTEQIIHDHLLSCGWTQSYPPYGPLSVTGKRAYSKPGHEVERSSSHEYATYFSDQSAYASQIMDERLRSEGWTLNGDGWSHPEWDRPYPTAMRATLGSIGLMQKQRQAAHAD